MDATRKTNSRRFRALFLLAGLLAAFISAGSPAFAAAQQPAIYQQTVQSTPIPGDPTVSQGQFRYFQQTTHFLRGAFLSFWETHGSTPVLGLPITEPIVVDGLTVQYLERARLEWHPEISSDPNSQVLLTRLGVILTQQRGLTFEPLASGSDTGTSHFFPETGHNLANGFLSYWLRNGGLAVFGYPISEEMVETNPADGKQYTVQYFERNRFEWHPELGQVNNVQLGLLGVEYARLEGLNPVSRVLLSEPVAGGDLANSPELAALVDPDLLPAVQELASTPQFAWVPVVLVQNNVSVQFTDIAEEGVGGAFMATRNRRQPYEIVIPSSRRGSSTEALASVLAHEATHAFDVTTGVVPGAVSCSVEEELRAYMNGLSAWLVLKGTGALAQRYPRGSLEAAVNGSFIEFLGGIDQLTFDFDSAQARAFIADLYGPSCGG